MMGSNPILATNPVGDNKMFGYNYNTHNTFVNTFVKVIFAIGLLLLLLFTLGNYGTSPEQVNTTLNKQGFEKVVPGELSLFGCGEDDMPGRRFVAVNPRGVEVEGIVCCGLFKNCTVRF